jgi:succinoglycan biosynthesis transport protein ExoP
MTAFPRNNALDRVNEYQPSLPEPMNGQAGPPGGATEGSRRNPLQAIWMRRWIVVFVTALALGAGVAQFFLTQRVYESSSRLVVEQGGPKLLANDPLGGVGVLSNFLNTQAEIMHSPVIIENVAARPEIKELPSLRVSANIVSDLSQSVKVVPGKKDDTITVSVRSTDPKDAADIANAVVDEYQRFQNARQQKSSVQLVDLLQRTLEDREKELNKLYQDRVDFQRKNPSFSVGVERGNAVVDRLNELSSALTRAQMDKLELEATYKSTKEMMNDPAKIAQLMNAPSFRGGENSEMRRQIRDMQAKLQDASAQYLPGYSGLQALQANIQRMREDLSAEEKKAAEAYLADLEAKLNAAGQREEKIREYLNQQQGEVLKLNGIAAGYTLIESDVRRVEKSVDDLSARLKDIKITEDVDRSMNIQVVQHARPGGLVEPDLASIMFRALAAGVVAGVGLALLRELTDQRLRSADEIKSALGMPILGVVPHITGAKLPSQRGQALHNDPMSDVAEAYRTIRTSIYFGVPAGSVKTLLVTSPAPGDGKTTLASNLAIAMAQAGNRILLLDADFRRPMQHRVFEIEQKQGLSNVLAGEIPIEQAIHHSRVNGLDVLPVGPTPANPSEILNSQMFADLLDELADKYDLILLDSPPVMPVTDARILAASADATVLALRAEKSTRKGAVYSRDVLRSVGSRLLGVVVNDVPRRKGVYGYYYTDAQYYTYGYSNRRNGSAAKKSLPTPPAPAAATV